MHNIITSITHHKIVHKRTSLYVNGNYLYLVYPFHVGINIINITGRIIIIIRKHAYILYFPSKNKKQIVSFKQVQLPI